MMTQTIKARYENGLLKPLTPLARPIAEGQEVQLVIETVPGEDILALAADVYAGLSDAEVDDIERVALDRSRFFDKAS